MPTLPLLQRSDAPERPVLPRVRPTPGAAPRGRDRSPPDATVRWTGAPAPPPRAAQRRRPGQPSSPRSRRSSSAGPPTATSACRTRASRATTPCWSGRRTACCLRDLDSVNGIFVGGRRIAEPVLVAERERVGIGPFLFSLDRRRHHLARQQPQPAPGGPRPGKASSPCPAARKKLLDNINLVIEPGEFVSLLGPSGSGKSTLMDCLNGRRRATGGQVLANGEDFYRHFDSFRQSLGYVPQKDIVHTQLTVYRALYYTARLRLPDRHRPGRAAGPRRGGAARDGAGAAPRHADRQPAAARSSASAWGRNCWPGRACCTSTRRPAASTPAPRRG